MWTMMMLWVHCNDAVIIYYVIMQLYPEHLVQRYYTAYVQLRENALPSEDEAPGDTIKPPKIKNPKEKKAKTWRETGAAVPSPEEQDLYIVYCIPSQTHKLEP